MNTGAQATRIRFGTFELDARAGELLRNGRRVPLQHQPFELLRALIEQPGQAVTREELRARLWANGAYVDFDRSLNKAMVKLRDALGDDAASPRFVETLPRHGYRFIGDVVPLDAPPDALPLAHVGGDAQPAKAATPPPSSPARSRRASWSIGALAIVAIVAAAASNVLAPSPLRIVQTRQLTDSAALRLGPLLSDGNVLYYSEVRPEGIRIMRLSLQGGGAQTLEFGIPDLMLYALSPDGSELLGASVPPEAHYEQEHLLWILPTRGGAPRPLGSLRAHSAEWARDGRIYFCAGNRVGTALPDGSDSRVLLEVAGTAILPRVSPDGRRLRFSVYGGAGRWGLWEAGIDGSSPHPLLSGASGVDDACCGQWVPDGSRFVFQAKHDGRTDLWGLDESHRAFLSGAREPERLSSGPMNLRAVLPAAAETAFVIGEQRQGELVRFDAARGEFVPFLGGISAEGVAFSRDGTWIAYVGYPEGNLWRSRIDGSDRRQLTWPPFVAGVPAWSPDGRRVLFNGRERSDRHWQAYVVSADGGTPQAVTAEERDQFGAQWSPDGAAVIVGGMPNDANSSLRIVDLTTRKLHVLPDSANMAGPIWSHDGKRIFAQATDPERILAFDLAAQRWSEVFRGAFKYWSLSSDDRFIYFDRGVGNNPGIYRVPVKGGTPQKVADLVGMRRAVGWFGPWFDLAPDDSPVLLRDISSQQIYALTLAH